jgi:hypothetical protein
MLTLTLATGTLTARSFVPMHGLAMFQAQDSINSGNSKLLMIFIGIAAFALLAQAIVMMVAGIGALKAINEIKVHVDELRSKAMPFISSAHGLVTDLTPEVKQITTKVHALVTDLTPEIKQITTKVHEITVHFEEISGIAKDKANEFAPTISAANVTVQDANRMSKEQLIRVDAMVTEALNVTEEMGAALRHSISAPGREITHLLNTAKATLSTFMNGTKSSVDTIVTETKGTVDTFVHGTKGTVETLLFGMKGLTSSLFGAKQKPVTYRPAAYRSNPAVPTPPAQTGFGEEKQPLDI